MIRSQIALDEFFMAKFLFAVDQLVQNWLKSCEQAKISRNDVNDKCLEFDDVIDAILNGTLNISFPPSFSKINSSTKLADSKRDSADSKNKGNENSDGKGRKKRKSEDGKGTIMQNPSQLPEFKLTAGKSWKDHFANILPHD